MVGNVEDFGANGRIEWAGHHVAHGTEVFVGHLEIGELFARRMNKKEIVDGGDEFEMSMPRMFHEFVCDRKEIRDASLVKACLHLHFSIVGDTHGVPSEKGAVVGHR